MLEINDIQNAAENIRDHVHKTPLIYSNSFSKMTGAEVYLKAENLQKTGSFKVRGAFNKMIHIRGKVIAASMGNHAQAIAFAARRIGIHAKIAMPVTAPIVKEEATKSYGAEVVLYGDSFKEALDYALSQEDYIFIHAFDDEEVIAGQGTIGVEIIEDLRDVDIIFVPVGGGGLVSGISIAVKALSPKTQIIGVQTESATSAYVSFREKKIYDKPPLPTLADGIAIGMIGEKAFEIMNKYVDDIILVREDSIAMAILLFMERKKLVVEGAGAVPLAALLENREKFIGKRIVLIVSGGNIDFTLVDRIIHKGLVKTGRIGVFEVTVDDIPGSLHSLTGVIASHRGNILDVVHDRFAGDLPVGKARVVFMVEIRNKKHLEEILSDLRGKGFGVRKRSEN
ncbi:MAG: threonine ammonia-lyase [Nitrospirota bacterium]